MRWEWKWDESYLTRTRRGERKRRGKEKTHTNTPSPERANPEKAREKKKRRVDGHGPRPTEGGEDGSAWTNLTQRKPTKTSARDGANLPGEGRKHEIGDQWGTSWWKQNQTTKNRIQFLNLEVVRLCHCRPVVKSCPNGIKQLPGSNELGAQYVSPHQKPKRKKTTPARRVPAWFIMSWHDVELAKAASCKKTEVSGSSNGFHSDRDAFHWRSQRDNRKRGTSQKGAKQKGQLFRFT